MNALRRHYVFVAFTVIAALVTAALTLVLPVAQALLIGFDAGALVFLTLLVTQFASNTASQMRSRAAANEPDHFSLVGLGLLIVGVVLTAVTLELLQKDSGNGGLPLAGVTLAIAWVFSNALFTLHYAHLYYLAAPGKPAKGASPDRGGLAFPGTDPTPDYWDFAYFAFVLGMTFQVSDVEITDKRLRRVSLFHALLAFIFNIAVVALTVNLVATALGG